MMIRSRFSALLPTALAAVLSVAVTSSCMKTRSQIRREAGMNQSAPEEPQSGQVIPTEVNADARALDELRAEVLRMSGRLEELERTNQDLSTQNTGKTAEVTKLETRIQELEAAQIQLIENQKKKEREAPKVEPVALFERGKTQLKAKSYSEAVDSFTEYLKFPNAKFAEEAYILRGDAHSGLKQYKKAILDYSSLQEKYPASKKMPQALLKIGNAFDAMGMKSDAKVFFQELVDKYPRSAEAKKAAAKVY